MLAFPTFFAFSTSEQESSVAYSILAYSLSDGIQISGSLLTINHTGDLVICGYDVFTIENVRYTQTGNIIVKDNATFIIRNAELQLNQTESRQYKIEVSMQGTLITENARITSQEHFSTFCSDHSNITINNSEIISTLHAWGNSKMDISTSTISNLDAEADAHINIVASKISWYLSVGRRSIVSAYNCTIYDIWLHFLDYANATIDNLYIGLSPYWNIYNNETVKGISYNLTLTDVEITGGWRIYCYEHSHMSIESSTIKYIGAYHSSIVSVDNSTVEHINPSDFSRILVRNSTISGYNPSESSTVTRLFNVIALDEDGVPIADAELTLYDQNKKMVWNGYTNSMGRAYFNLTFTKLNYTSVYRLKAKKGEYYTERNVELLSDTPIILQLSPPFIKTPLGIAIISGGIIATIVVMTLTVLKRRRNLINSARHT